MICFGVKKKQKKLYIYWILDLDIFLDILDFENRLANF